MTMSVNLPADTFGAMAYRPPSTCPVCSDRLNITQLGAFAPRCPAPYARGRRAAATACQPTAPAGPGPCLQMRLPAGLPGSRGGRQASGRNSHVI